MRRPLAYALYCTSGAVPNAPPPRARVNNSRNTSLLSPLRLLIALARQDRVEHEREGRQALGAVLRAKSEEDDAALADLRLDHRRATADEFVAENPAAQQRVLRFGIKRDRAGARRVGDLEG